MVPDLTVKRHFVYSLAGPLGPVFCFWKKRELLLRRLLTYFCNSPLLYLNKCFFNTFLIILLKCSYQFLCIVISLSLQFTDIPFRYRFYDCLKGINIQICVINYFYAILRLPS